MSASESNSKVAVSTGSASSASSAASGTNVNVNVNVNLKASRILSLGTSNGTSNGTSKPFFLYLGGKSDAKDKAFLQQASIKYVLNCTPTRGMDPVAGCPNYYEKSKEIVYHRVPVFDNRGEDILAHMEGAIKFIEEGRHYGSVLVHCARGISRSASFVIGYLMKKNEMTFSEAHQFIRGIRPIVQPNTSFVAQLQQYDKNLTTARAVVEANSGPAMYQTASFASIGVSMPPPAPGPEPGPEPGPAMLSVDANMGVCCAPGNSEAPEISVAIVLEPDATIASQITATTTAASASASGSEVRDNILVPIIPSFGGNISTQLEASGDDSEPSLKRAKADV